MDLYTFSAIFLLCFTKTLQHSMKSDDHYIAAVVEAKTDSNTTWKDYFNIVSEAAEKDVDIIVFPESCTTVTKVIKVPIEGILKNYPIPALRPDLYDADLVLMSEAAKKYSMYVVINLHEELDCTVDSSDEICPESEIYVFNTNVVFDRTGAVIARYRKSVLYIEPNVTSSFEPEITIIDTDFGVKFGIVTSTDAFYQEPFMQLMIKNVKNIIVTSNLVNSMPYETGIQAYHSLAYAMDVNMLVAGHNEQNEGASGSGIYSGKGGTLISFISGVPTTKLLVATVPKIPGDGHKGPGPIKQNPAYFDGLYIFRDRSLMYHVSKKIQPGRQTINLVYKDVSCKFNIVMKERNGEKQYQYRAGAFDGTVQVLLEENSPTFSTKDCGVYLCTNDTIESCGKRFIPYVDNATAIFEELSIEATVPTPKRSLTGIVDGTFYPTSLDVYLLPLEPNEFIYTVESNDTVSTHKFTLNNKDAQLYSFGLWGRNFDRDGEPHTTRVQYEPEDIGKAVEDKMKDVMERFGDKKKKVIGDLISFV